MLNRSFAFIHISPGLRAGRISGFGHPYVMAVEACTPEGMRPADSRHPARARAFAPWTDGCRSILRLRCGRKGMLNHWFLIALDEKPLNAARSGRCYQCDGYLPALPDCVHAWLIHFGLGIAIAPALALCERAARYRSSRRFPRCFYPWRAAAALPLIFPAAPRPRRPTQPGPRRRRWHQFNPFRR